MGCGKNPTCWHQSSRLLIQVRLAKVQSQHKDEAHKKRETKEKFFRGRRCSFWNGIAVAKPSHFWGGLKDTMSRWIDFHVNTTKKSGCIGL